MHHTRSRLDLLSERRRNGGIALILKKPTTSISSESVTTGSKAMHVNQFLP